MKATRIIGVVTMVAGVILLIAGMVTWGVVTSQLKDEHIIVAKDAAPVLGIAVAGKPVAGPLTAWGEAQIIKHHADAAADGKTYAQMDRDDPRRVTVMNAAFLRTSLFASVIVYGIAALAMGLGVLFGLVGFGFTRLSGQRVPEKAAARVPATATS